MRLRIRICAMAALAMAIGLSMGVPARAAIFNSSNSSLVITFDPDTSVGGNEQTTILGVDPNPAVPPGSTGSLDGIANLNFSNIVSGVGGDFAQAAAGGDHATRPGLAAMANIVYPYGMGLIQNNDTPSFGGPSQLTLDFNFNWNVSDGWTGPVVAYQFLSLSVSAPGTSTFSVLGDFTYSLNVTNNGSGGSFVSNGDLDFSAFATGTTTPQNIFLFDSAVLTTGNLPNLGAGSTANTLNLTGSITFTALNDSDPVVQTFGPPIGDEISPEVFALLNVLLNNDGMLPEGMPPPEHFDEAFALYLLVIEFRSRFGIPEGSPFFSPTTDVTPEILALLNGGGAVGPDVLIIPFRAIPLPGAFAMGLAAMTLVTLRRRRKA